MKLATFIKPGPGNQARAGLCRDGLVYDLAASLEASQKEWDELPGVDFTSLLSMLKGGLVAMDAARRLEELIEGKGGDLAASEFAYRADEVKLLAPLPRPNSIRDFLLFDEHLENAMRTEARRLFPPAVWANDLWKKATGRPLIRPPRSWRKLPAYYKGNPDTVIGPGEPVVWPSYTERLDYELEFGFYVMGWGRDVPESEASELIGGFTIFNDLSARDVQMEEMAARLGPAKGKDFDTGNVMGPWLVTPDEVGDPYSLSMEAFVNGERWSSGVSSGMRFSFEEVIAYVSRSETLCPGDFFGSGTVGTGCGLELDRWIQPGDRVRLTVEKLGALENQVVRARTKIEGVAGD